MRSGWGSRGALWTVVAAALVYGACKGKLFTVQLEEEDVITVERGTLLEELLVDVGFGGFIAMDLTQAEELQNQGVEPGDIEDVALTSFELEAVGPSGADLSFLDGLELYVEAPGLSKQLLAWQDSFPAGKALVPLEIEPVDLTEYVTSERMTLTTEVAGRRPSQDTEVAARFSLDVGVTGRGACNQSRKR